MVTQGSCAKNVRKKGQDMKINIEYGNEVFSLPLSVMDYIDKTDELGIKLFLALASDSGLRCKADTAKLAKKFAVKKEDIEKSLEFYIRAGLITAEDDEKTGTVSVKKQKSPNGNEVTVVSEGSPSYTGEEIERILNERPGGKHLIDECSSILGKILSASETNRIIGLLDYLGFDPEYIIMLLSYCKEIDRLSVHYLEKTAYALYNEGIITYTALEEYLAEREKAHAFETKIRKIMGIGSRALTAKEIKFTALWRDLCLSDEMLTLAYETTVNNTKSPSMPYMNKLLSNWREAGYKTAEDVIKASEEYKKKKASESVGSFDTDEFTKAALERSFKGIMSMGDAKTETEETAPKG